MYLNAETQGRVLRHFHFALREHGVLVLGKSETMASQRGLFAPLDLRKRVFSRHDGAVSLKSRDEPGEGVAIVVSEDDRPARDAALELGPLPQLIVARSGELTFANLPARTLFAIGGESIGQRFDELPIATSPADLRGPVADVLRDCRRVAVGEVRFEPARGAVRRFAVSASPLLSDSTTPVAVSVLFEDVTRVSALRDEIERNRRELEQAYEELQSTIDELETTNEELQSANEELQTANEELQSTNEELETMNEELQSTNGQLEAINDELRDRTGEVADLNSFLEAILTSLRVGVVVVDRGQRIRVWNRRAEDLWGLHEQEALTQHLLSLDVGLPTERLAPALRAVLAGRSEREQVDVEAVDAAGGTVACVMCVLPLVTPEGRERGVRGAIILMEDAPPSDGRAGGSDRAGADLAGPRP
jgi:two-component system CheB/CheR fusion protein